MKYSKEQLENEVVQGIQLRFLFFWGHQPKKDGTISSSCFSQWWISPFVVDNIEYQSAEHWMMASKARLFKDEEMEANIIASKSPAEAKKYGRMVRNFEPSLWEKHRYELVKEGNRYKFQQHPDLAAFLKGTNTQILVEASPVDPIWGIGLVGSDPKASDPSQWEGLNLLGFALMEVRDEL